MTKSIFILLIISMLLFSNIQGTSQILVNNSEITNNRITNNAIPFIKSFFNAIKNENYEAFVTSYDTLFNTIEFIGMNEEDWIEKGCFNDSMINAFYNNDRKLRINESFDRTKKLFKCYNINNSTINIQNIKCILSKNNLKVIFTSNNGINILRFKVFSNIIFSSDWELFTNNSFEYLESIKAIDIYNAKSNDSIFKCLNNLIRIGENFKVRIKESDLEFIDEQNYLDEFIFLRGLFFYDSKHDFINANKDFNYLINKKSKNHYEQSLYFRGLCKMNLSDFNGAIIDFNKIINLKLNITKNCNYTYMDRLYFMRYEICEKAMVTETKEGLYLNRANCFYNLNLYNKALLDYNETIKINPDLSSSYYYRAIAKIKLKMNKASICSDLSKSGELGEGNAYEIIKIYCNNN